MDADGNQNFPIQGSHLVPLSWGFCTESSDQQWWSHLPSQACMHSWEGYCLQELFIYGEIWQKIV